MYQREELKENPHNIARSFNLMKKDIKKKSDFSFQDVRVCSNSGKLVNFQNGQKRLSGSQLEHVIQKKYGKMRTVANGLKDNVNQAYQSSDTIQMAQATISEEDESGTVRDTMGPVVNHQPFPHHAEQKVWTNCSQNLISRLKADPDKEIKITFIVDTPICPSCREWFEGTVWQELYNTGGRFRLFVEVKGNTVEIIGTDNTIWPIEITDSPTWKRMREYDKMYTFVAEQRNPVDGRNQPNVHGYVNQQKLSELDEQMQCYVNGSDEFKTLVEDCLSDAKNNVVGCFGGIYDFADRETMLKEMVSITLLTVMDEAPTITIPDINGRECNYDWEKWKIQLTSSFEGWLEYWIDNNLQSHRIRKE